MIKLLKPFSMYNGPNIPSQTYNKPDHCASLELWSYRCKHSVRLVTVLFYLNTKLG